jgi:hypothetical protein
MTAPSVQPVRSDAVRALALLVLAFVVGSAAGVAGDRAYIRGHSAQATPATNALREGAGSPDPVFVPPPIAALNLSSDQERRVREIAMRWRPKAAAAVAPIRAAVASMENDMFAEMVCVLTDAQRRQYVDELHSFHADSAVIATRLRLAETHACPR